MTKKLNEEYEEMFEMDAFKLLQEPKSKIITQTMVQKQHYYPLKKDFNNPEDFDDLIRLLMTTPSGDIIRIYIDSNGGRVDISEDIISKIYEARSRGVVVLAELGFTVASAATSVCLACDDISCSPHLNFMIHNWSSGLGYGHAEQLWERAKFNKKQSEQWVRLTYEGFLSPEEIEDFIKHPRDIEMDAKEVMERWLKMNEMEEEPQLDLESLIEKKVQEALALKEKPITVKPAPKKKSSTKSK